MDMIDDFIERKHGRQPVTYDLAEMKEILEETYGVMIYQEQVMQISNLVAGYSLGDADILRRAMGKKNVAEMDKQRARFAAGAGERGHPAKKSEEDLRPDGEVRRVTVSTSRTRPLIPTCTSSPRGSRRTIRWISWRRCRRRKPATSAKIGEVHQRMPRHGILLFFRM